MTVDNATTNGHHDHGNGNGHAGAIAERRNLVMFMPDQLRYDSLGCTGNPVIKTPNFDAFAREGTLFSNCFSQASVCTQSRCAMFTGQYQHTSAHRSLEYLLQPWEDNMFKVLKDAGYHVCSISPRGDLFSVGQTERSMNEYGWVESPPNWMKHKARVDVNPNYEGTIEERTFYKGLVEEPDSFDYDEATIQSSVKWLTTSPPEPFCLFIPLFYPHPPFECENPYYDMYRAMSLPPRLKAADKTGHEPKFMGAIRRDYGLDRATEQHWHELKAVYYGMISRLDDQLGTIVSILKDPQYGSLWDRTYTMMFTDHGEYLGDSDLIEKWPSGVSEVLVHDPLMIVGPDLPPGQINESMCEMVDLVPTVLELLGVAERYPHSGKSLVRTIKTNAPDHKPYAFSEGGFLLKEEPLLERAPFPYDKKSELQHYDTVTVGRAISARDKDWSYTYRLYEPAELYDRHSDPYEAHNLAEKPEHAAVCLKFERAILRWMAETSDYLPWQLDIRYPAVELESTKLQIARREAAAKFNH